MTLIRGRGSPHKSSSMPPALTSEFARRPQPRLSAPKTTVLFFSGLLDALEHHDRDLAARALLVLVVGRPVTDHLGPHARLLLRRRDPGARAEPVAEHLHLD